MKKPHVLNRAMFNRGGTSAYGRGITSNLVSDEQRQRFNYGGRVGFAQNSYVRPEFAIAAEEELRGPMYTKPWITERFRDKYYLDTASDVIDWTEFAEGLYDPKKTLGKALMQGAGTVFAASQLPKKEAAVLLGKGFGDFGKTIAERKEKIEDIAATGKMYEKVNVAKAQAAGEQAIDLEMIKQGLTGSDANKFKTFYAKNSKVDEGVAGVIGFKPRTAPLDKEKKLDVASLKEAAPGSVFKHANKYILVTEEGIDTDNDAFQIMAKYKIWQGKQNPSGS